MKARIRRISASVDTAISFGSSSSTDASCANMGGDFNSSTETFPHGYNPCSKSLDICVPESRIERMRKLLSSPLLRRRNVSQHGGSLCSNSYCHNSKHNQPPSSSCSSSPSSSPALGSSTNTMKTFGVSLESLSHHQHPHHHQQQSQQFQQHFHEEYYVRDSEQIVVPHQKAAHILGQVCPGCLTSAPSNSNSNSNGSINDTTNTTSSGHFSSHHALSHNDDLFTSSMSSSIVASPSSGTSSSSTTSSTSSAGGPCLIPFIVTRLCTYIENTGGISHEGLFRISGNAKLVDKLKQSFDVTGDGPLESDGDLAAAAALLKQFLRELPQPLIPNGSQFLDVIRSLKNDHETCILSLKALVSQLPDENYYTLRYLIRFLHRIAQRNDENRMTSSNLGIVFAPNIFRVCVDTYQGLKDQSAANEVVKLLITEFGEVFNETSDIGCTNSGAGGASSHEDLSSAISCDSESSCPFSTCPLNNDIAVTSNGIGDNSCKGGANYDNLMLTIEPNSMANHCEINNENNNDNDSSQTTSTSMNVTMVSTGNKDYHQEAINQLDRKRKDYKSKNHRTIEEVFDDDRCQSFDCSQTATGTDYAGQNQIYPHQRPTQLPQRCNSDGNSEEFCNSAMEPSTLSSTTEELATSNGNNCKQSTSSQPQEIIITNSSDSVSTDDNTTTTATSTGATVCSVVIGQLAIGNRLPDLAISPDDNLVDKCSPLSTNSREAKLHSYDSNNNNSSSNGNYKSGRSGSCGSDCTENMNIPASLSFASDDEDEDSLSRSIASECSGSSSSSSHSRSSSCSSHYSGHDGGCSSSSNENDNNQMTENNDHSNGQLPPQQETLKSVQEVNINESNVHLLSAKPWNTRAEDGDIDSDPPCLSVPPNSYQQMDDSRSNTQDETLDFRNQTLSIAIDTNESSMDVEAPISPSAYRCYLSNRSGHLDETTLPPSPPVHMDNAIYANELSRIKNDKQTTPNDNNNENSNNNNEELDVDLRKPKKVPGLRNRRLQSIRRKLKQFEQDFKQENCYSPSYENKMASSFARPLMIELSSLLNVGTRNLKDIENYDVDSEFVTMSENNQNNHNNHHPSENNCAETNNDELSLGAKAKMNGTWKYQTEVAPSNYKFSTEDIFNTIFGDPEQKSLSKISEMMEEIQRTLTEKREIADRPDSLDAMTSEQIFDEKLALQKALLRFEALYGRPNSKAERDVVRPVYDRYRLVKRYAARVIQKLGSKDANNELQPIIEHVQMDFTSPTHHPKLKPTPSTENATSNANSCSDGANVTGVDDTAIVHSEDSSSALVSGVPINDGVLKTINPNTIVGRSPSEIQTLLAANCTNSDRNFHEMTREEMGGQLRQLRQQKRNIRSVLRTFENDFYKKTGRRVEKEDRCNMSAVYYSYKNIKGKIRLLEALITKTKIQNV